MNLLKHKLGIIIGFSILFILLSNPFILIIKYPINNNDIDDSIDRYKQIEPNLRTSSTLESEKLNLGVEWSRTWGGSGYEYGRDVLVDSSNYIYFARRPSTLLKYNRTGDLEWTLSLPISMEDKGLAFDSLENIYAAGHKGGSNNRNASLVKLNKDGNEIWNRTWGSTVWDDARAVAIDSNDNIYVTGMTKSFGDSKGDIYLMKFNSSGHEQWIKRWNNGQGDSPHDISIDSNDYIFIAGSCSINYDDYICLIKYDINGNQLWNQTTTFNEDFDVNTRAIIIDSLNNIYLGGQTGIPYSTDYDIFLIKYNNDGIKQWEQLYGGDLFDDCSDLLVDSKNYIYIGGRTKSYTIGGDLDMLLMKYNSNGVYIDKYVWGGAEKDECWGIARDSHGNFLLGGNIEDGSDYDLCLVKLNPLPRIQIFSPNSQIRYHEIAPYFNISISDSDLNLQWYSLNDGSSHYFSSYTGFINQSSWNSLENGTINIKFYASDNCGTVFEEINVHKGIVKINQSRNAYAIIVGIENYPGSLNDLSYCRDDAVSIRNILTNEYNFEILNIISLLDSQATESAIINAFNDISSRMNEDDIFLFYYSGHGGEDIILGEFLCPYDSILRFFIFSSLLLSS